MGKPPPSAQGEKIICLNRKARHEYFLEELYEAGLVLTGSEVKSLRDGRAHLTEAYAAIDKGELYLFNAHIAEYSNASYNNHTPLRPRKMLVHRRELIRISRDVAEKGLTLIPTALYFKNGRAKVEFAVAKGKKLWDKRAAKAKRESDRTLHRAMRRGKERD